MATEHHVAGQRLDLVARTAADFAGLARRLGDRAIRADIAELVLGVATDGSAAQVRDLLDELDPDRRAVASFAVHTPTLDDVFLALTGSAAGAAGDGGLDRTGKEKAHA